MAIQSFSRSCSSIYDWGGGMCKVTFGSDSFDTLHNRSCELGGGVASLDVSICNTIFQLSARGGTVEVEEILELPPVHDCCVDRILNLAGSPFALPTAYTSLSTILGEVPPNCRGFAYQFICRETGDAARRARGLRHDALAIHATVKVVSFVASQSPAPEDDEEELVFWEEAEAGAGEGACAVCLEEMEEGKTVARLRCGHAFDKSCISRWLERKMQCPLCRSDVL